MYVHKVIPVFGIPMELQCLHARETGLFFIDMIDLFQEFFSIRSTAKRVGAKPDSYIDKTDFDGYTDIQKSSCELYFIPVGAFRNAYLAGRAYFVQ